MAIQVSFEVVGLAEIEERFANTPNIVHGEIGAGMNRVVQHLAKEVKTRTPVDTGRLRSSIMSRTERRGLGAVGYVESNVKYAPFVERGTKPHFPPLQALEVWARRHGTTAWNVAIGIARHGTKGRFMFERALKENANWINAEFQRVAERIARRLNGS